MRRIMGIVLFGVFLAGAARAEVPAGAAGPRLRPRVAGTFCTARRCERSDEGVLGHGAAFGAAALGALWMCRRRD